MCQLKQSGQRYTYNHPLGLTWLMGAGRVGSFSASRTTAKASLRVRYRRLSQINLRVRFLGSAGSRPSLMMRLYLAQLSCSGLQALQSTSILGIFCRWGITIEPLLWPSGQDSLAHRFPLCLDKTGLAALWARECNLSFGVVERNRMRVCGRNLSTAVLHGPTAFNAACLLSHAQGNSYFSGCLFCFFQRVSAASLAISRRRLALSAFWRACPPREPRYEANRLNCCDTGLAR